jgi:nitroimidazol reductase NimA-like FMN-containing flavoprotein (pyridoxamine 5'-phosphate oxidase superfamily)
MPETQVEALTRTDRTALRRKKERGSYDRAVAHAILDEGLVCHVGLVVDGAPVVLPTAYGRIGDDLYLHGATGNRMFRAIAGGADACVTVTLLDGLVLARSTFHHSMNYRSIALFGRGRRVTDPVEQDAALTAIVEHIVPGRTADARPPTPEELRATIVVRFPIEEGSAKVRAGGPVDDDADLDLPVWAGVLPLQMVPGEPAPDDGLSPGVTTPGYVRAYGRGGR